MKNFKEIAEKILTQSLVRELGLDKLPVITADMLDGYTNIGDFAFSHCSSLTSVTIPNSVTIIRDFAFDECESLTHVKIPNSVTSIGYDAFYGCTRLTSVTIPNSVTSIGFGAFSGCSSLTSINVASDNSYYCSVDGVLFNKNQTELIQYLAGNTRPEYIIPNSVTSIVYYAFSGCSSLTSVTIPNSVTSIGNMTFYECSGLTSVTIPNSVKSIGDGAFRGCSDLTSVTIGDKTYKKQTSYDGRCKAYKAFNADMTCHGFQYEEGKTYELDDEPILCQKGFHACLSLTDVFNYYQGKLGKYMVVHVVELEGVSDEKHHHDSKVVAKKITIGKRIL